jgi:hypothetical protein
MASGTNRMRTGVGAADSNNVNATTPGKDAGSSGNSSQGETSGAGSIYSAQLNERTNLSNMRNQGPTRKPSRLGESTIPVATMANRNTGRLS